MFVITAVIRKCKSIIKIKKETQTYIKQTLTNIKLNRVEVLIPKALTNSYIIHN